MRTWVRAVATTATVALLAAGPAWAQQPDLPPEIATGTMTKPLVTARKEMVVSANPLASEAGYEILKRGGNAVDAAIAVQLVLGLVEPQSSGLGGGAFLVYYDAAAKRLTTFDARETAPLAATENYFFGLGFGDAVASGLSTGVPGTPKLLETMHDRYARMPWAKIAEPAIKLATDGFRISPRLGQSLVGATRVQADPVAGPYFYKADGKTPKDVGTILKNPAYARAVSSLVENGDAREFYSGQIRDNIIDATERSPRPGVLAPEDFEAYEVIEREPVCVEYKRLNVCGMGPPSSGGIAVGQILKLLEPFDLSKYPVNSAQAIHLYTQANRLAFADRNLYVGDPKYVAVPTTGLLDSTYLAGRAALIEQAFKKDMGVAQPGTPPGLKQAFGDTPQFDRPATSHFSIVDKFGNAVSMTTTIESGFGSGRMTADGFLVNNELTDFNFVPNDLLTGKPAANRVEPGKRPRSSMAPTIIRDEQGNLRYVLGSPGGAAIISYVGNAIVGMLDWKLNPQQAAALPHFLNNNTASTSLEAGTSLVDPKLVKGDTVAAILARDFSHTISIGAQTSGLSIIEVKGGRLLGGADPRRENLAVGK